MSTLLNFILMSAGSKRECIETDVDLEALETDEIQTLLSDMIETLTTAAAKHYPIMEKSKGKALSYRDRYQKFFASLVEALRFLPPDKQKRGWTGPEVLRRVVEQLIVFSSLSVSNVRDAVAEATLSISSALCKICSEIKRCKEVEERMVGVEKGKSGGGAGTKYAAHIKQRDELSKVSL
ncbi:hypothetical protein EON65_28970 [archaeon]|nr:MAG: hypothetical protein EON65_28970 [archaeon]